MSPKRKLNIKDLEKNPELLSKLEKIAYERNLEHQIEFNTEQNEYSQKLQSAEQMLSIIVLKTFLHVDIEDSYSHWILGIYFLGVIDEVLIEKNIIEYQKKNRISDKFFNEWSTIEGILMDISHEKIKIYDDKPSVLSPSMSSKASALTHIYNNILSNPNPMKSANADNGKERDSVIFSRFSKVYKDLDSIYTKGKNDTNAFIACLLNEEEFSSDAYELLKEKNTMLDEYFNDIQKTIKVYQREDGGCLSILLPIIFLFQFFK
jgi:hypothetical protein